MAILWREIAVPPLVFLILLFFITSAETTNTEGPPLSLQNYRGTLQPGYLFARLLRELTQTKNKLVLCSASSKSPSQQQQHDLSSPTDVLQRHGRLVEEGDELNKPHATIAPSPTVKQQLNVFSNCDSSASEQQANFSNVKLVNVIKNNCKKDLVSCLKGHVVSKVMTAYREGLRRDLTMACCKLKYCGDSQDMFACQTCVQEEVITSQKASLTINFTRDTVSDCISI